jgi:hypothetical protein
MMVLVWLVRSAVPVFVDLAGIVEVGVGVDSSGLVSSR